VNARRHEISQKGLAYFCGNFGLLEKRGEA